MAKGLNWSSRRNISPGCGKNHRTGMPTPPPIRREGTFAIEAETFLSVRYPVRFARFSQRQ